MIFTNSHFAFWFRVREKTSFEIHFFRTYVLKKNWSFRLLFGAHLYFASPMERTAESGWGERTGQPQLTAARSLKEGKETILRFYLSVFPQLPCFMIQWNDVKLFFTNIFFSELIYWDFFLLFFPCLIELTILFPGFEFFPLVFYFFDLTIFLLFWWCSAIVYPLRKQNRPRGKCIVYKWVT
jgi:hypothetical protein